MALMPERAEYFYYHYYVDQVVSVAETEIEIGLYPNPAVDFFTIEGAEEFNQLDIFRLDGKLVDQITINSNKLFVDCNRFEAGTYLLRMSNESSSVTKKIIIR